MIGDFFNMLLGGIFDFFNGFFGIFPQMPTDLDRLRQMLGLDLASTVFGWVNWFLPLDIASSIVAIWSVAIMAYVGLKISLKYTSKII